MFNLRPNRSAVLILATFALGGCGGKISDGSSTVQAVKPGESSGTSDAGSSSSPRGRTTESAGQEGSPSARPSAPPPVASDTWTSQSPPSGSSSAASATTTPLGATGSTNGGATSGPAASTFPQGNTGATGSTGGSGASGSTGNTGASGASGGTGNTGATGSSGSTGASGSTGSTGASGSTGSTGASGSTGTQTPPPFGEATLFPLPEDCVVHHTYQADSTFCSSYAFCSQGLVGTYCGSNINGGTSCSCNGPEASGGYWTPLVDSNVCSLGFGLCASLVTGSPNREAFACAPDLLTVEGDTCRLERGCELTTQISESVSATAPDGRASWCERTVDGSLDCNAGSFGPLRRYGFDAATELSVGCELALAMAEANEPSTLPCLGCPVPVELDSVGEATCAANTYGNTYEADYCDTVAHCSRPASQGQSNFTQSAFSLTACQRTSDGAWKCACIGKASGSTGHHVLATSPEEACSIAAQDCPLDVVDLEWQ